jgi:hypothetical protein
MNTASNNNERTQALDVALDPANDVGAAAGDNGVTSEVHSSRFGWHYRVQGSNGDKVTGEVLTETEARELVEIFTRGIAERIAKATS